MRTAPLIIADNSIQHTQIEKRSPHMIFDKVLVRNQELFLFGLTSV